MDCGGKRSAQPKMATIKSPECPLSVKWLLGPYMVMFDTCILTIPRVSPECPLSDREKRREEKKKEVEERRKEE